LLGDVFGEGEVSRIAGERADDACRFHPPHGLDGPPRRLGTRRAVLDRIHQSWPVRSRHARSVMIHSLSCGNSSMLGTRRISVFVPGKAGIRLAHSTASSLEATSRM